MRRAASARRRAEAAERRRPGRPPRHRAVLAAAVLVAAVLIGMPAVLALSPVFALRQIAVEGASPAVAAQLRARLAPLTGTPLALVDPVAVRRAIAGVPAVAGFGIASLPPHTLQLTVVQRTAVAQQRVGDRWRTVDGAGTALDTGARDPSLPEVRGDGDALTVALDVLPEVPATVLSRLQWVGAASTGDVRLHLDRGVVVVWGDAGHGSAKAAALTAALRRAAVSARLVDVSSPGLVRIR